MKLYFIALIAAVSVNCLVTAINGETANTKLAVPFTDMLLPPFEDKADSSEVAGLILFMALMAAVSVNCLVTAINGETANTKLAVPFTDMLLPPFEDKADSSEVAVKTKAAENNVNATGENVLRLIITAATKKPITKDESKKLPEISIEALLPPLFEAKSEQEETKGTTTDIPATTSNSTLTEKAPLKSLNIRVPNLLLDPLLPPLVDNEIIITNEVVTTTEKSLPKPTKKSYYQQEQQKQQIKHLIDEANDLKNFNVTNSVYKKEQHFAEHKTLNIHVSLPKEKLLDKIESPMKKNVVKQIAFVQSSASNTHSNYKNDKLYNYNFDWYFGPTTARPIKSGLPTITPFPHRLRR